MKQQIWQYFVVPGITIIFISLIFSSTFDASCLEVEQIYSLVHLIAFCIISFLSSIDISSPCLEQFFWLFLVHLVLSCYFSQTNPIWIRAFSVKQKLPGQLANLSKYWNNSSFLKTFGTTARAVSSICPKSSSFRSSNVKLLSKPAKISNFFKWIGMLTLNSLSKSSKIFGMFSELSVILE